MLLWTASGKILDPRRRIPVTFKVDIDCAPDEARPE
jgi:hypothetical protein